MRHQLHDLIAPVPGTARQIHSFHFGPQQPEGKVYIQSSLHADELPGMLVAWHLKARLAELEANGRLRSEIVLVPVANPVGLEQVLMDIPLGRYELESGQNFNRLFVDLSEDCNAWPVMPTWCWTCIATSKQWRTCTPRPTPGRR